MKLNIIFISVLLLFSTALLSCRETEPPLDALTLTNVYDAQYIDIERYGEQRPSLHLYDNKLFACYTDESLIGDAVEYLDYTYKINTDGSGLDFYDGYITEKYPDYSWSSFEITEDDMSATQKTAVRNLPYSSNMSGISYKKCYKSAVDGDKYEFYVCDFNGVYGLDNSEGGAVLLCDWINSSVSYADIYQFVPLDCDKFACIAINPVTGNDAFLILTAAPDKTIECRIIEISFVSSPPVFIIEAARKFNLLYPEYRIVIKDYNRLNTLEDYGRGYQQYQLDLAAGKASDICTMPLDVSYYCDLYEFFNKDSDLGADNILSCGTAYNIKDGKMYAVSVAGNYCAYAVNSDYSTGEVMSVEDVYDESEHAAQNNGVFFTYMTKMSVFYTLAVNNLGRFADYESHVCSFNSDGFVRLLEYCGSYPDTVGIAALDSLNGSTEYIELYKSGAVREYLNFPDIQEYLYNKFLFDGKYTMTSFTDGKKSVFSPYGRMTGGQLAIYKYSEYKDAAWSFIKFLLSDEIQKTVADSGFYPSTLSGMHNYLNEHIGYTCGFNTETGNVTFIPELEGCEYYTFTEEDAGNILSYLNDGEFVSAPDKELLSLILEDASAYFNGDKTAAETAAIIQSRAEIYISERYG